MLKHMGMAGAYDRKEYTFVFAVSGTKHKQYTNGTAPREDCTEQPPLQRICGRYRSVSL